MHTEPPDWGFINPTLFPLEHLHIKIFNLKENSSCPHREEQAPLERKVKILFSRIKTFQCKKFYSLASGGISQGSIDMETEWVLGNQGLVDWFIHCPNNGC